jgi:hypothetical protein
MRRLPGGVGATDDGDLSRRAGACFELGRGIVDAGTLKVRPARQRQRAVPGAGGGDHRPGGDHRAVSEDESETTAGVTSSNDADR